MSDRASERDFTGHEDPSCTKYSNITDARADGITSTTLSWTRQPPALHTFTTITMKIQELCLITLISLIGASFASALDDKPRRGLRASAAQTAPRKLDDEEYDYYYTDDDTDDAPVDDAAEDAEYYYYEDNGDTVLDDAADDAEYYYYADNGTVADDTAEDAEYYYYEDNGDTVADNAAEDAGYYHYEDNADSVPDRKLDLDYYYDDDDDELGDDATEIEVFGNTTVNTDAEEKDDDYYDDGEFL